MEYIVTAILGVVFIVIGILNTKGNVKMLHSYHLKRVKKEDEPALGKRVGLGMLIMGCGMIITSALQLVAHVTTHKLYANIATGVLLVTITVGCVITILAINKYNKGLF